jgi:hypothetical protein
MKILKKIGIILITLTTIILIVAIFVSKEVIYEKSVSIDAPIEIVWENVNSLADLDKWSPWNDYDPNMIKEFTGTDGEIGATASWDSDVKEVGKGSQTITKIEEPNLFETDLKFYEPYESQAKGYIKVHKEDNTTKVTWGFQSKIPYPFNLMNLFTNMEEMMGKDWDKGLLTLKNICENKG